MKVRRLVDSFRFAFWGMNYVWQTQRNMRIHLASAATVMFLAWIAGLRREEIVDLLLVVAPVIITEMLNTALEASIDLISPNYHDLAKVAKNVAAGAVLFAALNAVAVGTIIFLPYFSSLPYKWFDLWGRVPGHVLIFLWGVLRFWVYVFTIRRDKQSE